MVDLNGLSPTSAAAILKRSTASKKETGRTLLSEIPKGTAYYVSLGGDYYRLKTVYRFLKQEWNTENPDSLISSTAKRYHGNPNRPGSVGHSFREAVFLVLSSRDLKPVPEVHDNVGKKEEKRRLVGRLPRWVVREVGGFERAKQIVKSALEASNGVCTSCGKPAPFKKSDGSAYLEVHHVDELSKGGFDDVSNVAAVCPNCHREIHYGVEGRFKNEALRGKLNTPL